jgi:hypothetical protein
MYALWTVVERFYSFASHDRSLSSSRHEPPRLVFGRDQFFRRLKRFVFHLQINLDVAISRFDGSVTQPGPNHIQVHVGLKQVHCGGVTPGMGNDSPGEQLGTSFRCFSDTLGDDVAHAKTGVPVAFAIDEKRCRVIQTDAAFF